MGMWENSRQRVIHISSAMAGRLDQPEGSSLQGTGLGTGLSKFLAGLPDIRVLLYKSTCAASMNIDHSPLHFAKGSNVFAKPAARQSACWGVPGV